jgi:peroxiredoxin Q/BCP
MAERPIEGAEAPDFTLFATANDTPVTLSDFRNKKVVALYFYPKDDTPGCTVEACAFRDLTTDFEAAGAIIFGISMDDMDSHQKFADKFQLPFPLLADVEGIVSNAYGVYKEKNFYGKKSMGIERTTFIIGKDGKIAKVYPRVKVDQHAETVLQFIQESAS